MQFKNIVAFVSLAVMASALPAENIVARTNPSCSTGSQTVQCCDTVTEQLVNGIPVNVGVNCVNVNVLSPISSQCSPTQKVVCCEQKGLVNVCANVL